MDINKIDAADDRPSDLTRAYGGLAGGYARDTKWLFDLTEKFLIIAAISIASDKVAKGSGAQLFLVILEVVLRLNILLWMLMSIGLWISMVVDWVLFKYQIKRKLGFWSVLIIQVLPGLTLVLWLNWVLVRLFTNALTALVDGIA